MKFALLIYGQDEPYRALSEAQTKAMYTDHERFGAMLKERGAAVGGAELDIEPIRTMRIRDGERVVTDGPFAEAPEGLGGWYMVEAADVDEATELARSLPILPTDGIEIRAVK